MGKPLVFYPGYRVGHLEVLDSSPAQTATCSSGLHPYKLWRVWCYSCNSESLVKAAHLNPKNKYVHHTCGCGARAYRGAVINIDSACPFQRIIGLQNGRRSGEVAPFMDPSDPKKVTVTDPNCWNYSALLKTSGESFLIGIYDEDSSSRDIREDYIYLLKSHCLAGTIDLQSGLDALESLIYKHRRKKGIIC